VASCAILFPVSERNTKMKNTIKASCDSPCQSCGYPFDQNLLGRNSCPNCIRQDFRQELVNETMEEHTLENWGKLPEGWTPAKELENNLKDIHRNLKNSA